MFKHGPVSTETDRKPFIFTLIALVVGLAGVILLFTLGKGSALAVFAGILLGVVTLAAAAVLFGMVTDRAYIEDGVLHMRYLFKHKTVPLEKIAKVTFQDDVYSVYDRSGGLRGTINGKLTGIDSILYELDRNGIPIG